MAHIRQPAEARAPAEDVYDEFRFNDHRSHVRWANYTRKSCVKEREFLLYPELLADRGWTKLAERHAHPLNVTLVREFYANAHEDIPAEVYSREIMVPFTVEAINAYYQIPEMAVLEEANPSIEAIVRAVATPDTIVRPGAVLPGFTYNQLTSTSKAWYNLICSRLIPCSHMTTMTMNRVRLLYKIVTGRAVNPGEIIWQSVSHAISQRTTVGLVCGGLITALCYRAGVARLGDDEVIRIPNAITDTSLVRFQQREVDRMRREAAEIARADAQQQADQGAQPMPDDFATFRGMFDAFEGRFTTFQEQFAAFQAQQMVQLNRLEEQRAADRAIFEAQLNRLEEQRAADRAIFEAQLNRLEEQRAADRVFFEAQLNRLEEQRVDDRIKKKRK